MSDAESVNSSTISFGDISVCEEIGQLIERCEDLNNHIHNSFETLQNINSLIKTNTNITVTYNNLTCDFDEIIETFHNNALNNIKENGENSFSYILLKEIGNRYFH